MIKIQDRKIKTETQTDAEIITGNNQITGQGIMRTSKTVAILFFCAITCLQCEYKNVYEKNERIPNSVWQSKNAMRFWYDVVDTTAVKNISVNLRHTGQFKYSNIFLFITTESPSGEQHRDTLEFTLANNQGKWFGRGLGDLLDIRMLFRNHVKFSQSGRYYFIIEQAMRDEKLEFVTDVGLRIEPAK